MSVETEQSQLAEEQKGPCTAVTSVIVSDEHDLGGFSVRRCLPSRLQRMVGPWIFFDHFGPVSFPDGKGVDVRPHPHINLATVTYLFEGEMYHRDSLGNALPIAPGAINLMVAGKGIVHSERQREEIKASGNRLHGLQLWLALPEEDEEIDPAFYHYDASHIPQLEIESVPIRVLVGTAYGVTSPVKTFASTLYVEASLQAGQTLKVPESVDECAVYVVTGKLEIEGNSINEYSMAVLQQKPGLKVTAKQPTRIAIVGGEKLSRRHIWWNFVSSRKERIEQAKQDWKSGAFPKIPGDEIEFIPLP